MFQRPISISCEGVRPWLCRQGRRAEGGGRPDVDSQMWLFRSIWPGLSSSWAGRSSFQSTAHVKQSAHATYAVCVAVMWCDGWVMGGLDWSSVIDRQGRSPKCNVLPGLSVYPVPRKRRASDLLRPNLEMVRCTWPSAKRNI